ncbi:SCO family protein [Metaplanococcus flavidus]|nr:SCO family protein [Planomicrobium okeanokoites]
MRFFFLAVIGLSAILILSACGSSGVKDFSYTDHRNETISMEKLKGTPWIATFAFTSCETVCPPMMFNMTEIQEELKASGIEDYKIVAFSVDPAVDTPEKLKEYLTQFSVPDESKWHLLTGYTPEQITEFASENFESFVKKDPNSNQVIHGTSFYLVDQEGKVTNNYDGFKDVPVDEIREDLENLIEK